MALEYHVEEGVLVIRTTSVGHAFLRDALSSVSSDPRFTPRMPILVDMRGDPANAHYEDIRWRVRILEEMRQQLGARWALVTGPGPQGTGLHRMRAALLEGGILEVGLFEGKDEALRWLTEK